MSTGILISLKGTTKKGRSWQTLVGYTIDQLKRHLESKFQKEMSWKNHGTFWHIDHIIPKSVFNFETPEDIDFKRCWSLDNLQPLEASENMRKNNRLDGAFQPSLMLTI